jgi:hypothetical protein
MIQFDPFKLPISQSLFLLKERSQTSLDPTELAVFSSLRNVSFPFFASWLPFEVFGKSAAPSC